MNLEAVQQSETWIINEALSILKTDLYAGKAWLLTARSLYPRNFGIQLEIYFLEKKAKNANRAAALLQEMLVNFPREGVLWEEVTHMTDALQAELLDDSAKFYKEVFEALPAHHQCGILLQVVETQTNVMNKCKLMVLVLNRYPETIPQHGMNLVESLLTSEENSGNSSPVNCYRKYLVCDILPQVLRAPSAQLTEGQVIRWLQRAIEFYIGYISQNQATDDPQQGADSTPKRRQSVASRRTSIQGLPDKECHISHPWQQLLRIVNMAGRHLRWNTAQLFDKKSRESQWQHIYGMVHKLRSAEGGNANSQLTELFYSALLLCFDCILNYAARMDPESFSGTNAHPLVLIEGLRSESQASQEQKAKKLKTELPQLQIHAHKSISGQQELIENLKIAVKCWELLQSTEQLANELQSLLREWRSERWAWFTSFQVDFSLYQGNLKDVITRLTVSNGDVKAPSQIRNDLQLACSYYSIGNLPKCCETVLGLIEHVKPVSDESAESPNMPAGSGRQLHIVPCHMAQVLPHCIHLLITCLREKAFKSFSSDDVSLGHMLVLMQYNWPRYDHVFSEVLDRIKRRGSFKYNLYFNYITNVDFLEEFMFLKSNEGGKISLDILPISNTLIAQSRTVTRGVNKNVKEDFKSSMEKQVSRSNESVETVIRSFLVDEKQYLQQSLI